VPWALSSVAESRRARPEYVAPFSSRTARRSFPRPADIITSAKSARLARRLTENSRRCAFIAHQRAQVFISRGLAPQT